MHKEVDVRTVRVAIVGGGPTAAALMESLNRAREMSDVEVFVHVMVFDPSPNPWSGQNFAPDKPEALSNAPTSEMSLRPWEPGHVNVWFEANGYAQFMGHNFAPRSLIGQYFQASATIAAARMETFGFVRQAVVGVDATEKSVRVSIKDKDYLFDYCVLCVGNSTDYDPYGLQGKKNCSVTPYPLQETLRDIDPDEHIGIIGCGLTAIDLVLALKADKHRGPITMMSKNGLLPVVRRSSLMHQLQHFTVKSIEEKFISHGNLLLSDLLELAYKEFASAGASQQVLIAEIFRADYGFDRLRDQISQLDDDEISLPLAIMWAMAATTFQDAWYFLDPVSKEVFNSKFRYIYNNFCCPMPKHRALEILELSDMGQLSVLRGLKAVSQKATSRFVATVENDVLVYFDRTIQASFEVNKLHPMATPVVDSLLQSGQASAHHYGGLNVERTTSRLLSAYDVPQERLFAVGTATGGAFQFLNGLSLLQPRTMNVATSIFEHFKAFHYL